MAVLSASVPALLTSWVLTLSCAVADAGDPLAGGAALEKQFDGAAVFLRRGGALKGGLGLLDGQAQKWGESCMFS